MRMLVRFGDPLTPANCRDRAWLDTSQPPKKAAADGLGWFYSTPFRMPSTMRVGAVVSDGLNIYEVLKVESPLFEVGSVYSQRFIEKSGRKEGPAIHICAKIGNWYFYTWRGRRWWHWYIKKEDTLLKFLTGED